MVLAAMAESAGLFAGLRRRLVRLAPAGALWASLLLVAATSAALLNDAAVVVLVPFLLPALRGLQLKAVPVVVLMAVAANVGSLLTPFGNPQNAVLAAASGLDALDFLAVQGPLVVLGMALLAVAAWIQGRPQNLEVQTSPAIEPAVARGRPWVIACIALFLAFALGEGVLAEPLRVGTGWAALGAGALAFVGMRLRLGAEADRAAWRGLDKNVLALFVGLYFQTAALPLWVPPSLIPTSRLDDAFTAAGAVTLLSNLVGNVPATLALLELDPPWVQQHAAFLVTVTTLGGALLLTGSAASLLAADMAKRQGVEVRFAPFLRTAAPWVAPLLVVGAWWTWWLGTWP
jgi:Na+/H+ antiporter NhaD/arsenite permease-like protein